MSLLDLYKSKNNDPEWFDKYFSLAKDKRGKIFGYINTNYRTQKAFLNGFQTFEEVEGEERSDWATVATHGQEKDKHHVIRMLASKLFKRISSKEDEGEFLYYKTKKGRFYKKFIEQFETNDEEVWFLNFIFLLNGHYSNTPNHIYEKVSFFFNRFHDHLGLEGEQVLEMARDSLNVADFYELVKKDFFYFASFNTDTDTETNPEPFLKKYLESSDEEKKELHEYIIHNHSSKNDECVISKKYKSGGNYSFPQALDEIKVFYNTGLLMKRKSEGVDNILSSLAEEYVCIKDFFEKTDGSRDIVKNIFLEFYGFEEDTLTYTIPPQYKEDKSPQEYIDDTSIEGKRLAKQIFALKKPRARELSGHKCSLEKTHECKYFISRSTTKNYIEVHHLIPQAFRNEFENSIEVLPNYVTLCPHCHGLLHKGIDKQRLPVLDQLYKDRIEGLKSFNLFLTREELYGYYKVNEQNPN